MNVKFDNSDCYINIINAITYLQELLVNKNDIDLYYKETINILLKLVDSTCEYISRIKL